MSQWIEKLEKKQQMYTLRFGASLIAFATFIGLIFAFRNTIAETRDQMMVTLIALVVGMLILPRRAMPQSWPRPADQDQAFELEQLRTSLRKVETTGTILRIVYLLVAAVLIWLFIF